MEFQLKTDTEAYPGVIVVGEDGVLRTELGGSGSYLLSCLASSVAVPAPGETTTQPQAPSESTTPDPYAAVTDAPATTPDAEVPVPDDETQPTDPVPEDETGTEVEENTIGGIPVKHIILFGSGLLIAVGSLVAIRIVRKRRSSDSSRYDDSDDDDEY